MKKEREMKDQSDNLTGMEKQKGKKYSKRRKNWTKAWKKDRIPEKARRNGENSGVSEIPEYRIFT